MKMDKSAIQHGVLMGDYTLKQKNGPQKDNYWETFRLIFDASDIQIRGYVCCSVCKTILVYDTSKNGTQGIKNHWQTCKPGGKVDLFVQKRKTNFTTKEKELVLNGVVRFCCKDLRPFYAIYGDGLLDFLTAFISVAHRYGNLDKISIESLLPCPNTVSDNI